VRLFGELLRFRNGEHDCGADASEVEEVLSGQLLGVAHNGTTVPNINVKFWYALPSSTASHGYHAPPPGALVISFFASPIRNDRKSPRSWSASSCRRSRRVSSDFPFERGSAKRTVRSTSLVVRLGTEAEIHRVAALQQPRRLGIAKEPGEKALDDESQLEGAERLPRPLRSRSEVCLQGRLEGRSRSELFCHWGSCLIASFGAHPTAWLANDRVGELG